MGLRGSTLTGGTTLKGGDWLASPNGQYSAVMQDDGNFVLYWGRYPDRLLGPMWATDTGGKAHPALYLQTDGDFVLRSDGGVVWSAATPGKAAGGPVFAAMQDNGDFALWGGTPDDPTSSYWATGTWQGTLVVEVDGPYIADVTVNGQNSGHIKQGSTNRGMVHFPVTRTATADFSVVLGKQHFGLIPLGARRSQLYTVGGTSLDPTGPTPSADHGPY
jgi:hypothetical protein